MATSSQRVWGEGIPQESEEGLKAIRANFPDCASIAAASLRCAQDHHGCKSDPCRHLNDQLQFCIMHSYCPSQAEEFAKCCQKYNKPVNTHAYPRGCTKQFNRLDSCLIGWTNPVLELTREETDKTAETEKQTV